MEHRHTEKEIAKELTLQLIAHANLNLIIDKDKSDTPDKIGAAVAALYNAILDNLHD